MPTTGQGTLQGREMEVNKPFSKGERCKAMRVKQAAFSEGHSEASWYSQQDAAVSAVQTLQLSTCKGLKREGA